MSKQIITYPYPPMVQLENGDWYEMPDPVTLVKMVYDLRNRVVELEKQDESGHWYCIPVEHVKEFESWVYNNNKEVNFEEYRLGSHISRYIFRNPVEA